MELEKKITQSNRPLPLLMAAFLILTLVVSALPTSMASAVTCKYKHKVQEGETLIYIGNLYTVAWTKIADANNLNPPYTVTAGQVLCIPEGEKTSDVTSTTDKNKKNATLEVVAGLSKVLVAVENFPAKKTYYIRIYPADKPVSYRIGHFTTNKEGDFTNWFRVPSYVYRSPDMTLCVKNATNDNVSCVKYGDLTAVFPFVIGKCSPKEGR